jgi:thiol-disulfide isomerase/thioredoxin
MKNNFARRTLLMKRSHLALRAVACLAGMTLLTSVEAREKKVPIGAEPEKFTFKDIRYLPRTLDDFGQAKAYVIVFTTTGCPLVQRYLPRLKELSAQYRDNDVQFLAVNVGPDDSIKEVAYQALEHGVDFPFVKDFDGECARALGANRTPQVVVLDAERKIRYRGRIDNQYRLGGVKPSADREDLKEAIEDVLAGRKVRVKETAVDGCAITFPATRPPNKSLTFAKDVAPLINKHCVECHRPGTAAPFTLTSYEKVAAKAGSIAEVVDEQRMPPWFAHPGFGKFMNQRGLTAEERDTIVQWARSGKTPGDLSHAPKPPEFPDTKWLIGEPDLIITASQPETIPATGYIAYRYVILPHLFEHDTWVQGIQIMPGNSKVVHHANLAHASLTSGFDEDKNFITGIVPGGIPVDLDSSVAMMIPKGAGLVLQIHYVTTGKEETDQISVGLRFAKEPIHKRVRYKIIGDYKFRIPPGAPAYPVTAQKELECDATGVGLFSHMHLRGKDSTFFAHYPDGKTETLLSLPNYSFDWQLSYVWPRGAQHFPKGTKIECSSHFDNSPFNPYNPNPKATVRNGPQTHDEMMQGFLFYTDDSENLNLKIDPKTGKEIKEETKTAAVK